MSAAAVPLTSLVRGGGCGCKLPASALELIVRALPRDADPRLLVDSHTADDAGVVQLTPELALVQTVDFFTPIVDDAYDFGRIAAANALSDIYAMGGRPLSALNIVAFPLERLGADVLREVLRGGGDVVREAETLLVGGHSIDDPQPKYGLAVTGLVRPDDLLTNAGGEADDELVLTKPLGVGAITTAFRRGAAGADELAVAVAAMTTLNAAGASAARAAGAHALTDVTGFGLLGHLHEVAVASGLAAELDAAMIPALPGVARLLAGEQAGSGGGRRTRAHAEAFATFDGAVAEWQRRLVTDPQTSGGLLAAVPAGAARDFPGVPIGRLVAGEPGTVRMA